MNFQATLRAVINEHRATVDEYIASNNSKMLYHLCFGGDSTFMTLPQRVRVMFKSYVLRRLLLESTPVMFWSFHHDQEDYIVEVAQEMLRNYASENEVYDFLIEVEAITTEEKVVKIMDDIFNKQRPYWWGEVYNPKYRGNVFDMSWKHWKHLEHEELS